MQENKMTPEIKFGRRKRSKKQHPKKVELLDNFKVTKKHHEKPTLCAEVKLLY